tara:strand:+ start:22 stop:408 length:387 start_codon:yes stop_codon:yes gene_type:complete
MKIKSAKAKGRNLQNYVRDKLRLIFVDMWTKLPQLEYDDIKSQTMGMGGEDIVLSPIAKKLIPYSFECKNTERLNLWKALEQCETNCEDREPVLVIKRNRTKTYAIIEFDSFANLIKETVCLEEKEKK